MNLENDLNMVITKKIFEQLCILLNMCYDVFWRWNSWKCLCVWICYGKLIQIDWNFFSLSSILHQVLRNATWNISFIDIVNFNVVIVQWNDYDFSIFYFNVEMIFKFIMLLFNSMKLKCWLQSSIKFNAQMVDWFKLIGTMIFQIECYIRFAIEMGDVEWNVSFTTTI